MKRKILFTAAISGMVFSLQAGVQASTLENETIGIKMEIADPVFAEVNTIDLKAIDMDGEEVGTDIFKDKDYTMINVWATNCNPCLNELPELAEWEQELPDNVQILYLDLEPAGIASADTDMIEMIIEKADLNRYHVLLCENGFSRALDILVHATPTTFFVDSNGKIVGDIISGADVDGYKEVMDELLAGE